MRTVSHSKVMLNVTVEHGKTKPLIFSKARGSTRNIAFDATAHSSPRASSYFTIFTANFTQGDNLLVVNCLNGTFIANRLGRKDLGILTGRTIRLIVLYFVTIDT